MNNCPAGCGLTLPSAGFRGSGRDDLATGLLTACRFNGVVGICVRLLRHGWIGSFIYCERRIFACAV